MYQAIQNKIIKKSTLYIIYGVFIALFGTIVFNYNAVFADTSVNYNVQIEQALNVTVSSNTISLDLNPESKQFGTEDLSVSVGTNYINGYKLYIRSNSTDLTNSALSSTIPTLASTTSASSFPANYWGYRISSGSTGDSSITDENYHEFTSGTLVSSSSAAVDSNTSVLTFAAKADYDKPAGTYANTFTFNAVANPVTYSITYADNTGDTVSNLPTPNPQTGMVTSGSATVSSTIPTRDGYTFEGWCKGIVSSDGTVCTGTQYSAGDEISFSDSDGPDVAITLYATWEKDGVLLYDEVASMTKGTLAANSVALSDNITTANSGVYTYDPSVYGAVTDGGSDYDIYFYRGIIDKTFASVDHPFGSTTITKIGSSGDGTLYPNYVKLGTTCWRIVRTTGSGGTKMVYNGEWTGITCANANELARLSTLSSFNKLTGTSKSVSIVGIGYTYNADYVETSSTTQAGVLFGTNSNYSGNTTDSDIKGVIDSWYVNTLASSYGGYLEGSAGYCNDRSVNSGKKWTTYDDSIDINRPYTTVTTTEYVFGSYMRNFTTIQKITLGCPRSTVDLYTTPDSSNGNKQLTHPVALLTADEITLAGSGSTDGGSNYAPQSYLRSGGNFWSLSPRNRYPNDGAVGAFYLYDEGYFYGYNYQLHYTYGVRPVISLKHDVRVFSGSGTAADPWEISYTP